MSARLVVRRSGQALWSRRVGLFAAQLLILTALLHRFEVIDTPVAVTLLAIGIGAALLAVLLGLGALIGIWRNGTQGAGRALTGLLVGILTLALPAWYLPDLFSKPGLTDITTALDDVPQFQAALAIRAANANRVASYDRDLAEFQTAAYPDIRPMTLEKSPTQTFQLVLEAVEQLGWKIVATREPGDGAPGRIEAVAKTPIMGFADDVVIRVSAGAGEARIDARSASRYGEHDFGSNASHIRTLFGQIEAGLEAGEKLAREIALATRAEELRTAREARLAKERVEREEREAREREELLRTMRERTQIATPEAPPSEANPPGASERGPAYSYAPNAQAQTAPRRRRGWAADPHKFWQQFQD